MDPLIVRVPTTALKALLAEHPEVEVRLADMACEKVAEEIMRKVTQRKAGILASVEAEVGKVIERRVKDLESRFRLPVEAKSAIRAVIEEEVKDERSRASRDLSAEATRLKEDMAKSALAIAATVERTVLASLSARVSEQARAEFFDVLREANAAGVPTRRQGAKAATSSSSRSGRASRARP